MKKVMLSVIMASSLAIVGLQAAPYKIDMSHSAINFKIGHMIVANVNGNFAKFSGNVDIDPKTKTLTKLDGEIDITSINTRDEERDGHLLGDAYFDAGAYPKGTLKATKITKTKSGIRVEADLTLRGVTKKVVFLGDLKGPVQHPMLKKEIFGLMLQATINRKDFNIGKDTPGATMGESVDITVNLELHPQ
ncbi:MAG: YceI family protein [Helicobacter trogontum]|uniref:YceI family protein n=1 Tax=Helicobacter trogontum TaxID=50960 RepID=UPI00242F89D5|nr:YceI family protein [Helicobacter trogontum]MCI5787201.1 YceI family protein [Helicobacter trogontum]